jgi:hypothetical protein
MAATDEKPPLGPPNSVGGQLMCRSYSISEKYRAHHLHSIQNTCAPGSYSLVDVRVC